MKPYDIRALCRNCKHFEQYYLKYESGFRPTQRGHCEAQDLTPRRDRYLPYIEECEFYQEKTTQELTEKNIDSLMKAVDKMSERLLAMSEMLKSIKENY